jgi:hypothetical protein
VRPLAQQTGGLGVALRAPVLFQTFSALVDDPTRVDGGATTPFAVPKGMIVTHGGCFVVQRARNVPLVRRPVRTAFALGVETESSENGLHRCGREDPFLPLVRPYARSGKMWQDDVKEICIACSRSLKEAVPTSRKHFC